MRKFISDSVVDNNITSLDQLENTHGWKSLETFKDIKQVVFDKTGTLTTGHFSVAQFKIVDGTNEADFKSLVYALEKYSNHPIAKCISLEWDNWSTSY